MAFWSGEKLLHRLEAEKLIEPFDKARIDCAAYTLRLGAVAYTSGDDEDREAAFKRSPAPPGVINIPEGGMVTIRPGQFAFLMTEEKVTIPYDSVGFISMKARHKFAGLINVSGFHVDPGWSSPLIFAVLNAGPKELVYKRGDDLFLIFYADLDRISDKHKPKNAAPFTGIPADFIEKMSGSVPSLFKLSAAVKGFENKLTKSETELKSGLSETKTELKGSLSETKAAQSGQIDTLKAQVENAKERANIAFALMAIVAAKAFVPSAFNWLGDVTEGMAIHAAEASSSFQHAQAHQPPAVPPVLPTGPSTRAPAAAPTGIAPRPKDKPH